MVEYRRSQNYWRPMRFGHSRPTVSNVSTYVPEAFLGAVPCSQKKLLVPQHAAAAEARQEAMADTQFHLIARASSHELPARRCEAMADADHHLSVDVQCVDDLDENSGRSSSRLPAKCLVSWGSTGFS